ncbi:MAG: Trp biosynthesis-associated membrane protein [Jiangellaceae bacterium]
MNRRDRIELIVALVLLVAGGVLCVVGGSRVWGEGLVDDGLSRTVQQVSGRDLFPLGPAVGLVALAAVIAVPATRRTGRRIVGVLLAVAGAVAAVGAYGLASELPIHVATWLETTPAAGDVVAGASAESTWALLTVIGGLLVAVAGIAVAVRGPRWPGMGRRYERGVPAGDEPTQVEPAATAPDETGTVAGRETWDALDRGEDPTS